ncbi:MAG TPA: LapA family protein [Planctomycetota bacterium]
MNRTRSIVVGLLAVLAAIVVFQNTQQVETRLLFATVTMPRAVLLFLTLVTGFVIGLLFASRSKRKPDK